MTFKRKLIEKKVGINLYMVYPYLILLSNVSYKRANLLA